MEEMPQQSLLHSSRRRPPSCHSLWRRELEGKDRKTRVRNPGIVADLKLALVKAGNRGGRGLRFGRLEERPGTGPTYSLEGRDSLEGREEADSGPYFGGPGLRCDPGVKCVFFPTSEGHLSPLSWGRRIHDRTTGRAALSSLDPAAMEVTDTGKTYRSHNCFLMGWSSGAKNSRNTPPAFHR